MIPDETAARKTSALLDSLWKRNLPRLLERLDRLDLITSCATSRSLDSGSLEEATDIVHKLAGSLGMFGFHEGTHIAREIEVLLQDPGLDADLLKRLTSQLRMSLPLT